MRERILAALGRMIVRDGLSAIGINALAREANCDKVLLYRYFGDLEGVYDAFASRGDFWWTLAELTEGIDPAKTSSAEAVKLMLRRSARAVRARPVTLAVLAAEPAERTPLVVALEAVREQRALELSDWFGAHFVLPDGVDLGAITMLIGVGLNYLAVRARKIRVMSGVAIRTDKDWGRLFAATDTIIDRLFAAA